MSGVLEAGYHTSLTDAGWHYVWGDTTLSEGAWHHVVFVYDGTVDLAPEDRIALYLDGVLQAESVATAAPWPGSIQDGDAHLSLGDFVGSDPAHPGGPGTLCTLYAYAGLMDEYALWGSALTAADVTALHEWGLFGLPLAD
jgi:hypothetical protein